MTHNDDKESHFNRFDAQVTHSAFSIKEIVCKPQMKQNNRIKSLLDANSWGLRANFVEYCSVEWLKYSI